MRIRPKRPAALAAALCLVVVGCQTKEAPPPPKRKRPPTPVEVAEVRPAPLARTINSVGSLRSPASTRVTADIGGKVVLVDVPEGKSVEKGHILARLDGSASGADLAVAKARLEGAKDVLTRARALEKERLIPAAQVDEADSTEKVAKSEVARQTVTLSKTVIRAPFAGVVGIREVSVGAYVSPGSPITTITSVAGLELIFSVPERDVSRVKVGQKIRGMVGACTHRFEGEIGVVEPAVDPSTRTLRVMARIDNDKGELRPGMSASVRIEVETVDKALSVPQEALIRQGTRTSVLVVDKESKAARKNVVVGEFSARTVEIVKGLEVGDRVIASGHQKARPGKPVAPKPYEPVDNSNLELGIPKEKANCWF